VKVLVLTEYPAPAAGLALQGELLCRGLREMGVDVYPVHLESSLEKNGTIAGSAGRVVGVGSGAIFRTWSCTAKVWNEGRSMARGRWLYCGTP